jgi:ABC-type multidrug transport system fused ATPase/permease subunit
VSQGLNSIASVLSAIVAISGATKGTFLILLLPIAVFYQMVQKFFKATNTSVARLESISRSPIYADFSQALNGMTTIRAYNDAPRFIEGLERCVDANSVANVTDKLAGQWLGIRLDLIGALISFFMAVLAAAAPGFIPPGFLALGLMYSFQLTTYLKFLVRMMAQLEAQLNSVERVKYYMDNIECEGGSKQESELAIADIPAEWPAHGEIVCKDVEMRYRDGPLVLKGLSFNVAGAEKIGVAGRTGSGKSSLMIGLFRIQELAGGSITIDNIDIAKVPLTLLRSKLGIIPQDPVMFSASVRFNLDPFDKHTDAEIWQVRYTVRECVSRRFLRCVRMTIYHRGWTQLAESINMRDYVQSLPNKLQEDVAEGGDNFSAGQRQLICIARAILRKPKILVLDEVRLILRCYTDCSTSSSAACVFWGIMVSFFSCVGCCSAPAIHSLRFCVFRVCRLSPVPLAHPSVETVAPSALFDLTQNVEVLPDLYRFSLLVLTHEHAGHRVD